jgi:hypothetical protein
MDIAIATTLILGGCPLRMLKYILTAALAIPILLPTTLTAIAPSCSHFPNDHDANPTLTYILLIGQT